MTTPVWEETEEVAPSWNDTEEVSRETQGNPLIDSMRPEKLYPGTGTKSYLRGLVKGGPVPLPIEMQEALGGIVPTRIGEAAAKVFHPETRDLPYTSLEDLDYQAHQNSKFYNEQGSPGMEKFGEYTGLLAPFAPEFKSGGAVGNLFDEVSNALRNKASKLYNNATGATANQIEKLGPNAGRELRERGMIKFGDDAENIANRLRQEMQKSNSTIDQVLSELEEEGVKVDKRELIKSFENKISSLSSDTSKAGDARQLKSILDDLKGSTSQTTSADAYLQTAEDPSNFITPTQSEITKRGFQDKARAFYGDPERGVANKTAASIYRGATEDAATSHHPALADKFLEAKKTYGLYAPVEEAAHRRALQMQQSPAGGMMDTATAIGGGLGGGAPGAVAAPIARRMVAPRLATSGAVTLDFVAGLLKTSPSALGGFAQPMSEAFKRGPQAAAATHFILSSQYPSYREITNNLGEDVDGE